MLVKVLKMCLCAVGHVIVALCYGVTDFLAVLNMQHGLERALARHLRNAVGMAVLIASCHRVRPMWVSDMSERPVGSNQWKSGHARVASLRWWWTPWTYRFSHAGWVFLEYRWLKEFWHGA